MRVLGAGASRHRPLAELSGDEGELIGDDGGDRSAPAANGATESARLSGASRSRLHWAGARGDACINALPLDADVALIIGAAKTSVKGKFLWSILGYSYERGPQAVAAVQAEVSSMVGVKRCFCKAGF